MKLGGHLIASPVLFSLASLGDIDNILVAILASVFIDIDHIFLLYREKQFSYSKVATLYKDIYHIYKNDPEKAFKDVIYIFHTLEFNLLLLILSLYFPWLRFIFYGFMFHILCDIIHHKFFGMPILRWLFFTEFIRVNSAGKYR